MSSSTAVVSCTKEGCTNDASKLCCSACHKTPYCSTACSKADWATHKSECMSEKNINAILDAFNAEMNARPVKRPSRRKCTGCGTKFARDEDDEDGVFPEDECEECGYMACESCVCDTSNGSCYCQNSNFGRPYCFMEPRWYHGGRKGSYNGDRHPEECEDEAYEATPRKCGNCGELQFCLKKEYF